MGALDELMQKIRDLRRDLERLVGEKESFIDPEVLAASRMLDALLNQYYDMLRRKKNAGSGAGGPGQGPD
ncbi:MAG: aspartyl-phosphate phosphatase Spo0E family protein, partial [Thermoleophilia bacterium]|nr:aspartyl-phosphate phosphatase Spo0E family protein [Thermoleophilia bacterium]